MSTTLQNFKKFELVQLAEKLKLNFPAKANKPALVELIESHLKGLRKPLNVHEFPELKEYYDESGEKATKSGASKKDAEDEDEDEGGESQGGLLSGDWFSQLRFDSIKPGSTSFNFKFHEVFSDIQTNIAEVNETIQDTLSTIPAIDTIFFAIEIYLYIVKPFFHFDWKNKPFYFSTSLSRSQFVSLLFFWLGSSFAVPALIGYYINFIRYDLPSVEIDPLIFHVAKTLIALVIGHYWRPSLVSEATYAVKDTFGVNRFSAVLKHGVSFAQLQWSLNLQHWPLIFGITGIILCLYVL